MTPTTPIITTTGKAANAMTPNQRTVLDMIAQVGPAIMPVIAVELPDIDPPAMTMALHGLASRGFIRKDDRKYSITDLGRDAIGAVS